MILNFIFSNLNAIILGIWILFLIVVSIRFFFSSWVKNISFLKLIFIALGLNIFFGLFITWSQYYVWLNGSDVTKVLLNLPLPKEVPFPLYFEWIRPLFENNLGYFLYYIWGRIWFNILLLFLTSSFLYFLFKIWKFYWGGFKEEGPELILVLMLISGFPGILVSVSLGFALSVLWSIFSLFKNKKIIKIEQIFIFTTFFALLFTRIIFNML